MIPGETVASGAPHPGTDLRVLQSPAGFYLGYLDRDGLPYSRETRYMTEGKAESALKALKAGGPDADAIRHTYYR